MMKLSAHRKLHRNVLSMLLSAVLILSVFPQMSLAENAVTEDDDCAIPVLSPEKFSDEVDIEDEGAVTEDEVSATASTVEDVDSEDDEIVVDDAPDTETPAEMTSQSEGAIELVSKEKYETETALKTGESMSATFVIDENCYVAFAIDANDYSYATATVNNLATGTEVDQWSISSGTTYKGMLPLHPGTYELVIESTANATVVTGIEYQANTPTESLEFLEEEPNNSRSSANVLTFGKTTVGTLCTGTASSLYAYDNFDNDFYVFELDKRMHLNVAMSTGNRSSYYGFYLMDQNGKTLVHSETGKKTIWGTSMLAGTTVDFTSAQNIDCGDIEPGTYYLEVTGMCSSQLKTMAGNRYQFQANLSKPTPIVDTSCALLRSDGSAWVCSSDGEPIQMMAFRELKAVKKLFIEADVEEISRYVSYNSGNSNLDSCFSNLRTVEFLTNNEGSNACTTILERAFYDCGNLSNIVGLENTKLTSIGDWAFSYCGNLSAVRMPNTLRTIGEGAFKACEALSSVRFSRSLRTIGSRSFSGCNSLRSVSLSSTSLVTIEGTAFYECTSLQSISVPKSLKKIGIAAFYGCVDLKSVNGLGSCSLVVVKKAFENCTSLTSLTFPKTVTSMEGRVFSGCTSLKKVVLRSGHTISFAVHGHYTFEGSLFAEGGGNGAYIYVPYKLIARYKAAEPDYTDRTWLQHLRAIAGTRPLAQPLKARANKSVVSVPYSRVKKARQTLASNVKITKAGAGKLTYSKSSASVTKVASKYKTQARAAVKKFAINSRTGKLTVPKGTPKATYTIRVKIAAAGDATHFAGSVTITYRVVVKY